MASTTAGSTTPSDPIVQYVVLRKDLVRDMEWPQGAAIAQACHASTAAIWSFRSDTTTIEYVDDLKNMHKVLLEIDGEDRLRKLSENLTAASVLHELWVEQPEAVPTALATKPYHRSAIQKHFKKLRLFR